MAASQLAVLDASGNGVSLATELEGAKHTPQQGSRDGAHESIGAKPDAPAVSAEGSFSLIALIKRLVARTAPTTEWIYAPPVNGIVNTTAAVAIRGAGGAGIRNYVTSLQIVSEALTNATEIAIRDGAGGPVLWRSKITATGWPAGHSIVFRTPLRGSANTLLEVVTLTASGAGAVYVNAQGFSA